MGISLRETRHYKVGKTFKNSDNCVTGEIWFLAKTRETCRSYWLTICDNIWSIFNNYCCCIVSRQYNGMLAVLKYNSIPIHIMWPWYISFSVFIENAIFRRLPCLVFTLYFIYISLKSLLNILSTIKQWISASLLCLVWKCCLLLERNSETNRLLWSISLKPVHITYKASSCNFFSCGHILYCIYMCVYWCRWDNLMSKEGIFILLSDIKMSQKSKWILQLIVMVTRLVKFDCILTA